MTKPMLGFKNFTSAIITLSGIEIVRMLKKKQIMNVVENQNTANQLYSLCA